MFLATITFQNLAKQSRDRSNFTKKTKYFWLFLIVYQFLVLQIMVQDSSSNLFFLICVSCEI